MKIKSYQDKYKNQVIALILYLQNFDNKVDLSLEEQPDMNDINQYYLQAGGGFWIAVNEEDDVVGTIGLLKKAGSDCGVLKKFFVEPAYRGKEQQVSSGLYQQLLDHAAALGMKQIVLDSPNNCYRAYQFYRKKGFVQISKEELPLTYDYPERDSALFLLDLL